MYSLDYKDTERDFGLRIYGLEFETKKITIDELNKYLEIDVNDFEKLEGIVEELLGEGSVKQINDKRVKDGYKPMSIDVLVNVISFIMEKYSEFIMEDTKQKNNKIKNTFYNNDNYNRNYRRNNRRYKNYNRRY